MLGSGGTGIGDDESCCGAVVAGEKDVASDETCGSVSSGVESSGVKSSFCGVFSNSASAPPERLKRLFIFGSKRRSSIPLLRTQNPPARIWEPAND